MLSFTVSIRNGPLVYVTLILTKLFCLFFGFQGHHFMMAQMPNTGEMIPAGFTADGSRKYRITGNFYGELFDNLQVSDAALNEVIANIFWLS